MAIIYLLDTSIYSQPLKPKPSPSVQARWNSLSFDVLSTSVICEAELLYGLRFKQSTRLNALYSEWLKGKMKVFPVDEAVADHFAEIKSAARVQGRIASDFDFLIAATAKAHNLILVTLNFRHFAGIPGLAVEQW